MYKRTFFGVPTYTQRPKAPKFIVQPAEINNRLLCKTTKNPLFSPFFADSAEHHLWLCHSIISVSVIICRLAATSFALATSFAVRQQKTAPLGVPAIKQVRQTKFAFGKVGKLNFTGAKHKLHCVATSLSR